MSSGREKEDKILITLDPQEFNEVVKRVHTFLMKRVDKAKQKKKTRPSDRADNNHIEAAKDVFVFVHMMELIDHMSEEITELRDIITAMGGMEERESTISSFEMFAKSKKSYLN